MDTTFLSCLLVFALLSVLVLYLYQTLPNSSNPSNSTSTGKKGEAFFPIIFDTCNTQRTSGMPVHRVGPVHNFHQTFNKYNPALLPNNTPTGIHQTGNQFENRYLLAEPTGIHQTGNQFENRYLLAEPTGIHQTGNQFENRYLLAEPTGIPEMGWRNFYLSNFSQNQVPPQDPFSGTPIRNFLDNLENVDNLYRKCF